MLLKKIMPLNCQYSGCFASLQLCYDRLEWQKLFIHYLGRLLVTQVDWQLTDYCTFTKDLHHAN